MKKAFDANVSRAKPRVRLGALMTAAADEASVSTATVEALAQQIANEPAPVIPSVQTTNLGDALKARALARANRATAAEALQEAISADAGVHRGAAGV